MENFLWRDLNILFVFVGGNDGGNGAHKNVVIPVGLETTIVEITHLSTVKALNLLSVNIANLIDLRSGSPKAGENYSEDCYSQPTRICHSCSLYLRGMLHRLSFVAQLARNPHFTQ